MTQGGSETSLDVLHCEDLTSEPSKYFINSVKSEWKNKQEKIITFGQETGGWVRLQEDRERISCEEVEVKESLGFMEFIGIRVGLYRRDPVEEQGTEEEKSGRRKRLRWKHELEGKESRRLGEDGIFKRRIEIEGIHSDWLVSKSC